MKCVAECLLMGALALGQIALAGCSGNDDSTGSSDEAATTDPKNFVGEWNLVEFANPYGWERGRLTLTKDRTFAASVRVWGPKCDPTRGSFSGTWDASTTTVTLKVISSQLDACNTEVIQNMLRDRYSYELVPLGERSRSTGSGRTRALSLSHGLTSLKFVESYPKGSVEQDGVRALVLGDDAFDQVDYSTPDKSVTLSVGGDRHYVLGQGENDSHGWFDIIPPADPTQPFEFNVHPQKESKGTLAKGFFLKIFLDKGEIEISVPGQDTLRLSTVYKIDGNGDPFSRPGVDDPKIHE